MVHRLGAERRAADLLAERLHATRKDQLHHDDTREHEQRPPLRCAVRRADLLHGVPADEPGHREDEHRHRQRRQRLGLAVAVGVILVRRARSDAETRPDEERRQHIEQRLRRIRHQRVGVAEDAAGELHRREHEIQRDAAQHQRRAVAGAAGGAEMMFGRRHSAQATARRLPLKPARARLVTRGGTNFQARRHPRLGCVRARNLPGSAASLLRFFFSGLRTCRVDPRRNSGVASRRHG